MSSWKRLILVVGPARGGTTYVGKVMSFADEVGYLFEPDVARRHPSPHTAEVTDLFRRVPWFEEEAALAEGAYDCFRPHLDHLVTTQFDRPPDVLVVKIPRPDHLRGLARALSADRVVFIRRQSLAVMNSYHKNDRLAQPVVRELVLNQTRALAKQRGRHDILAAIERNMSSWQLLSVGLALMEDSLDELLEGVPTALLDYEEACGDYLGEFRKLYSECDLKWSEDVEQEIAAISDPVREDDKFHSFTKRSEERRYAWKRELAPWQIKAAVDPLERFGLETEACRTDGNGAPTLRDNIAGLSTFLRRRSSRVVRNLKRFAARVIRRRHAPR